MATGSETCGLNGIVDATARQPCAWRSPCGAATQVPGLRAGARVSVSAQEIVDYVLEHGDAAPEGNETGAIIMRRQREMLP